MHSYGNFKIIKILYIKVCGHYRNIFLRMLYNFNYADHITRNKEKNKSTQESRKTKKASTM